MAHPHLTFPKEEINKAIELAARENYERDLSVLGLKDTGLWSKVKKEYLEEAGYLLKETGVNWEPELSHHHRISIQG